MDDNHDNSLTVIEVRHSMESHTMVVNLWWKISNMQKQLLKSIIMQTKRKGKSASPPPLLNPLMIAE